MDKLTFFRESIINLLEEYVSVEKHNLYKPKGVLDLYAIYDKERDHYQVFGMGWKGDQQTFVVLLHLTISNNKIWIHRLVADFDLLHALEEYGIKKDEIVLAFNPPAIRPITGYAVA